MAPGSELVLTAAEVGAMFAHGPRLAWNALSPFADELASYDPRASRDVELPPALREHPLMPLVAPALACPDVRVTHRYVGAQDVPAAFTACARRDDAERVVVVTLLDDDRYEIREIPSSVAFVAGCVAALGRDVTQTVPNDLPPPLPVVTLLYALHAADAYRRVRHVAASNYEADGALQIEPREFVESLAAALASRNPRWLLPAFLRVTPGLEQIDIGARREHLEELVRRGVLRVEIDPRSGAASFTFGEACERLGGEFLDGVGLAVGLEVAVWTRRGVRPFYEAFLAPTDRTNHLVEITRPADGRAVANHQAMTQRQLFAKLVGVLSAALHPEAPARVLGSDPTADRPGQTAASTESPGPTPLVCAGCGHGNAAAAKFCVRCGTRLTSAADPQGTRRCPNPTCGAPVTTADARFCAKCGTALPLEAAGPRRDQDAGAAATQECLMCHRSVPTGKTFCTGCGSRLPPP
jgi:hypothetical protein